MQSGSNGKYTVAVVLDEIGLAEASAKMPLKVSKVLQIEKNLKSVPSNYELELHRKMRK